MSATSSRYLWLACLKSNRKEKESNHLYMYEQITPQINYLFSPATNYALTPATALRLANQPGSSCWSNGAAPSPVPAEQLKRQQEDYVQRSEIPAQSAAGGQFLTLHPVL